MTRYAIHCGDYMALMMYYPLMAEMVRPMLAGEGRILRPTQIDGCAVLLAHEDVDADRWKALIRALRVGISRPGRKHLHLRTATYNGRWKVEKEG